MPREKAIVGQRRRETLRRIEHHLDDAFDVPIDGFDRRSLQPKPASDRRADLRGVEFLALDLAGLHDVEREGLEFRLPLQGEAKAFHPAKQPTLPKAHFGGPMGERLPVPVESGPFRQFVNVADFFTHFRRRK